MKCKARGRLGEPHRRNEELPVLVKRKGDFKGPEISGSLTVSTPSPVVFAEPSVCDLRSTKDLV